MTSRNPIAKAVTKIAPRVIPDKRRKILLAELKRLERE